MATDLSSSTDELSQLLRRLADRERVRSEATVQADVRQLLLTGGLGLGDHDLDVQLETQVGDRRRIDVEVGCTVIEVKKDLRNHSVVRAAEEQLAGYVAARAAQTGQRYVGVLTDGLTNQLPTPPLRVVYGKAGMHVCAALMENPIVVIDHTLYWGAVSSRGEGFYLCALLNSPAITDLVRPLMSYGKDERHIDKHVWKLPIPLFDDSNPTHRRLSDLGRQCADLVAGLDLGDSGNFVTLRRRIRSALAADPSAAEINEIVLDLLST